MLIKTFAPLGNLNDLTTKDQLDQWSREVETLMTKAVNMVDKYTNQDHRQFADPSKADMGTAAATPIGWKGFPLSLLADGFSEEDAFKIADGLTADHQGLKGRDVQDEYLEWYVHRDAQSDITQIDFTTEGPEYWTTLVELLGKAGVMALYQKYYPAATEAVVFPHGEYDGDNIFNNGQGAMHLRQASNNLDAEVDIAALSTISWTRNGQLLQNGADLCNYAQLGEPNRASDPHIAETVNGVAQGGCRISLKDPIGLYMDPPDFAGWKTPDGSDPKTLWVNERGNPLTRASLRSGAGFKLSEVEIGGQNLKYGGQVAKLIGVHLTGLVSQPNAVAPVQVSVDKTPQHGHGAQALAFTALKSRNKQSQTGR